MNRSGNTIFMLLGSGLILYGVFGESWYGIGGGLILMVIAGLDDGGKE